MPLSTARCCPGAALSPPRWPSRAGTRRGGAARPAPTSGCTGSDVALTEKTRSEPKKGQVRQDAAAGAPAAGRRAGRAAGAARLGWAGLAEGSIRHQGRCFGQGTRRAGAPRLRSSPPGFNKGASLGRSERDVRSSALGPPLRGSLRAAAGTRANRPARACGGSTCPLPSASAALGLPRSGLRGWVKS